MPAALPQHQIDELRRTWRPVTEADLEHLILERVDSSALDIGLLISSGAMEPPHVAPRALTVSPWQRFTRWVRVRFGWAIYR